MARYVWLNADRAFAWGMFPGRNLGWERALKGHFEGLQRIDQVVVYIREI